MKHIHTELGVSDKRAKELKKYLTQLINEGFDKNLNASDILKSIMKKYANNNVELITMAFAFGIHWEKSKDIFRFNFALKK